MAKEVIWSDQAILTFNAIIKYLEMEWSEKEIVKFVNETERVIALLSEYPTIFRKTNLVNVREALVTPHNLLIYQINYSDITLVTFWDTRQNPKTKKQ